MNDGTQNQLKEYHRRVKNETQAMRENYQSILTVASSAVKKAEEVDKKPGQTAY